MNEGGERGGQKHSVLTNQAVTGSRKVSAQMRRRDRSLRGCVIDVRKTDLLLWFLASLLFLYSDVIQCTKIIHPIVAHEQLLLQQRNNRESYFIVSSFFSVFFIECNACKITFSKIISAFLCFFPFQKYCDSSSII